MFAATRIAWAEFRVGFSRRSTGAAGVRDFVSLAAFFGLMMFLVLFGWSVRDGLWGRIEQVLLGALPDGQAPIRLGYHIDNQRKIDSTTLAAFHKEFPDLAIVPQRNSDGKSGALVLPGLAVVGGQEATGNDDDSTWGKSKDGRRTEFRIEAMPLDSPLWEWILRRGGTAERSQFGPNATPLVVAASRKLFREHFRYDLYRDGPQGMLRNPMVPCALKQQLPARLDDIDRLEHLVLAVRENIVGEGGKRSSVESYQSFRVVWVDSFPTPMKTALIVPLSTFEVLQAAAGLQTVDLHAETLGATGGTRVGAITLADLDIETAGVDQVLSLANCLGAIPELGDVRQDDVAPKSDICAKRDLAPVVAEAAGRRAAIGSCQQLRQRIPVKYPRLINNGQDLMICAGEHRPLRAGEVAACGEAAGLTRLKAGERALGGRLNVSASREVPEVSWLGAGRIGVPCGALRPTDLVRARELHIEHRRWVAGRDDGAETLPAWISQCDIYKSKNPDATSGGPRAVLYLDGDIDVTVYPPSASRRAVTVPTVAGSLAALASGDLQKWPELVVAVRSMLALGGSTPGRGDLSLDALTKALLDWKTPLGRTPAPVFVLDSNYESALVRFGVLSLIIEKVSTPIAVGSVALYLFLSAVILSTAIAHRRRQYGLLLMTGIKPGTIGYIVALQIVLSCVVGGVFGYGAFEVTAWLVNKLLADSAIVAEARMLIGLDVPSFLPAIGGLTTLALWAGTALLSVVVGTLLLRLQGVTRAPAPIELVKS